MMFIAAGTMPIWNLLAAETKMSFRLSRQISLFINLDTVGCQPDIYSVQKLRVLSLSDCMVDFNNQTFNVEGYKQHIFLRYSTQNKLDQRQKK